MAYIKATRIYPYKKTSGERTHEGLIKEAKAHASKKFGLGKHQGSKPHSALKSIINKHDSL